METPRILSADVLADQLADLERELQVIETEYGQIVRNSRTNDEYVFIGWSEAT